MEKGKILVLGLAFVCVSFLLGKEACAKTILVPQSYKTIQQAVDAAAPGDIILVSTGLYKENVDILKPVFLKSVSGKPANTEIRGIDKTKATIFVHDILGANDCVVIAGFKITNGGYAWGAYAGGGAVFAKNVNEIRIYNNQLVNNQLSGVRLYIGVLKFDIRRNVIMNNTSDAGGGIKIDTSTDTTGSIVNNIVAFNNVDYWGGGVVIYTWNRYNLALELTNNTIAFNTGSAWSSTGAGVYADPSSTLTVVAKNNIIWGNTRPGSSGSSVLLQNIAGISVSPPAWVYNDVGGLSGTSAGPTNINANPLFANTSPTSPNLHLGSASPCLNAGCPSDDNSNEPLPNGGMIDMGGYGNTAG